MTTMAELARQGIRYQALDEEPQQEESGDFSRGFQKAMVQIPQTLGGTAALVGDLAGSEGLRDYGLSVYEKNKEKSDALTRDSDSFSNVLEGNGSVGDFLQSGAGYVTGQAVTALATGGAGGFIGSQLAKRGIRNLAETQAVKLAAAKGAKIGAGTALFGSNLTQEAGSIYPEALEQAESEGRTLDGMDKARIVGSSVAAAGVDTAMDALMIKGAMAGGRKMVMDPATNTLVPESLLKSVPREMAKGMARESGTEGVQSGIERYGAGKELTTADAVREYVDSMALGALGGGLGGAAGALHSQKVEESGSLTRAANVSIDQQILQLEHSPDPWISFPDGSVGKQSEVDAYISSLPEAQRADARAKLLGIGDHAPKEVKRPEPTSSSQEAADSTLKAWSSKHEPQNLDYVQKLLQTPGAKGLNLMVVPHASGKGYTALPSKWLSIDDQVKYAALQKEQTSRLPSPDTTAPDGNIIVDGEGGASKETYADKARAAQGKKAAEDEAHRRIDLGTPVPKGVARPKEAENVESSASSTGNTGVVAGDAGSERGNGIGTVPGETGATDAAGGFGLGAQNNPDANAGTAAELILNAKGEPFKVKVAAVNKVRSLGQDSHEVVPVDGGFAVRKKVEAPSIDDAAHTAATSPTNDLPEPTPAQKEAGNYKKGHVNVHGMDISIENPAGSVRSGVDRDGKAWKNTLKNHYGYIKGTVGADKDHIDTFIGKNPASEKVFIVDQVHPHNGKFDEHKVILGADTLEEAKKTYAANYAKGWKGGKDVSETSVEGFKTWLKDGDTKKPFATTKPTAEAPSNNLDNLSTNVWKNLYDDLLKLKREGRATDADIEQAVAIGREYSGRDATLKLSTLVDDIYDRASEQEKELQPVPLPANEEAPIGDAQPAPVETPAEKAPALQARDEKIAARDSFTIERGIGGGEVGTFTFKRGEYVSVGNISAGTGGGIATSGEIEGISHARKEAKVNGQWSDFMIISKAEKPAEIKPETVPLSKAIESNNKKTGAGLTEADAVPGAQAAQRDTGEDIPVSYFKKTKVDHDVWIEDEKKFETVKVSAKDALTSVRDDIANYSNLLNCLRGH